MASLRAIWTDGPPLHWSLERQALASTIFGAAGIVAGKYLAPKLIRDLGPRPFTSMTNILNTCGFALSGVSLGSYDIPYFLGLVLHIPGINNTSAAAMKGIATDHAVANGFARGEYGGMYSSIRTFSMIVAPLVFGWAYKRGPGSASKASSSLTFGLPWFIAALLGGALPELLHRSLSDEDLRVPKPEVDKNKAKSA